MFVIRQLLTNADNATHNVIRHLAFWGGLTLVGLQAWAIAKGQTFNALEFGGALASLAGGTGIGLGASTKAEQPEQAGQAGQ